MTGSVPHRVENKNDPIIGRKPGEYSDNKQHERSEENALTDKPESKPQSHDWENTVGRKGLR